MTVKAELRWLKQGPLSKSPGQDLFPSLGGPEGGVPRARRLPAVLQTLTSPLFHPCWNSARAGLCQCGQERLRLGVGGAP